MPNAEPRTTGAGLKPCPTRAAALLVALALVVSATAATGGAEATTRIVILHDNDLHFTLNSHGAASARSSPASGPGTRTCSC
jgi:hypothetical protein